MRLLTEKNIEDIALGAAVLGTGGGGDPYIGMVMARQAIRDYGPVELYGLDERSDCAYSHDGCAHSDGGEDAQW